MGIDILWSLLNEDIEYHFIFNYYKYNYIRMVKHTGTKKYVRGTRRRNKVVRGTRRRNKVVRGTIRNRKLHGGIWGDIVAEKVAIQLRKNMSNNDKNRVDSALHNASRIGLRNNVVKALTDGADINSKDEHGYTALLWAILNHHVDIVELLVKKHANVNTVHKDKITPLILASSNKDNLDIVGILLRARADVNAVTIEGVSSLMEAVNKGNILIIKLLLEYDADVNLINNNKMTALMLAIVKGYNAYINYDTEESLHTARRYDIIVDNLLEKGADVNIISSKGRTALTYAINMGNATIVWMLLRKKANMNVIDEESGTSAFILAVLNGNKDVVDTMLKAGADVNATDSNGRPVLMDAIIQGHEKIVALLLENGVDMTVPYEDNKLTVFLMAINKGNKLIIEAMLNKNRNIVNIANIDGHTPLMEAASLISKNAASAANKKDIINMLIVAGAHVNAVDIDEDTALMRAIMSKSHIDIVNILLNAGADVNKANRYRNTPVMIAERNNNHNIVKILKAAAKNTANF